MRSISRHLPHYLSLIGILAVGTVGFVIFSYDKVFQMGILIAVAAGYLTWGIVHHAIHRDLNLSVVIEYLVVAILGFVVVFSLIFRS
jgi:hypothetical protein